MTEKEKTNEQELEESEKPVHGEAQRFHDVKKEVEKRAVLAAIYKQGGEDECEASLDELERLCDTADVTVIGRMTQMRSAPDGRTILGQGKIAELAQYCKNAEATHVIFDYELSPSQIREVEDEIDADVQVIDRSMLILDIFAAHARTAEGRLQVELAQLRYTAPRLIGKGRELSRLGGGIGTRGPGESKLEIDRRRIKEKCAALEEQLRSVEKNRQTIRAARVRDGITKCAIVGYTNAGKSTLLNMLTDAGILAEDKLFATLDPTTRQYTLPGGASILLTDTVGFIRKLPHHLIKAFRSTLDEAAFADILIIVADASDSEVTSQLAVVDELLSELGAADKPRVYVFNKCDLVTDRDSLNALRFTAGQAGGDFVFISAVTGEGIDLLAAKLENTAKSGKSRVALLIPNTEGGIVGRLYADGEEVSVDYRDDGIYAEATVDNKLKGQLSKWIV